MDFQIAQNEFMPSQITQILSRLSLDMTTWIKAFYSPMNAQVIVLKTVLKVTLK